MTYLRVEWHHNLEGEPFEILMELDSQRKEMRGVERFRGGASSFAGPEGCSGSTVLSEKPVPTIEQIAADPQFSPSVISADEFERWWQTANISAAA